MARNIAPSTLPQSGRTCAQRFGGNAVLLCPFNGRGSPQAVVSLEACHKRCNNPSKPLLSLDGFHQIRQESSWWRVVLNGNQPPRTIRSRHDGQDTPANAERRVTHVLSSWDCKRYQAGTVAFASICSTIFPRQSYISHKISPLRGDLNQEARRRMSMALPLSPPLSKAIAVKRRTKYAPKNLT